MRRLRNAIRQNFRLLVFILRKSIFAFWIDCARFFQNQVESFVPQTPYTPDVDPSDLWQFPKIKENKKTIPWNVFYSIEELKNFLDESEQAYAINYLAFGMIFNPDRRQLNLYGKPQYTLSNNHK